MFDDPRIPRDPHAARARELRAAAAADYFARLVAFFRSTDDCPDCDKPAVIS